MTAVVVERRRRAEGGREVRMRREGREQEGRDRTQERERERKREKEKERERGGGGKRGRGGGLLRPSFCHSHHHLLALMRALMAVTGVWRFGSGGDRGRW